MPENDTPDNFLTSLFEQLGQLVATYGVQVIGALVTLVVGFLVSKFISSKIEKLILKSRSSDRSLAAIARKISFFVLIAMVFITVLEGFGVETTSLIAVLGALGLAAGLAIQGTLTNVASGLMLLILRPFREGDAIQVGSSVIYIIDEIGLFVTKAHQLDCPRVTIPNSKIWGDFIVNFTDTHDKMRRFDIIFPISYSQDPAKAIHILESLAARDGRIQSNPPPFVKVNELADSSLKILFRAHTRVDDWLDTSKDFNQQGCDALQREGFAIPFPQRSIHVVDGEASKLTNRSRPPRRA